MTVLIAGGGIGGLSVALTCHQLGIPVLVLESVSTIAPLGVGINLQPNAVRELDDLGLGSELATIGIQAKEWALVGRNGNDIWAEPRGLEAGYHWPQYSVHRGKLQMLLYHAVLERLGPDAVRTGQRVVGFRNTSSSGDSGKDSAKDSGKDGVEVEVETADGARTTHFGAVLIGADGLHSKVRAQMYPTEGAPRWGGAIMWRGTTEGLPIRTGASFVLVGSLEQRIVCYPITNPDPETGLATINWVAEITVDPEGGHSTSDWNKQVDVDTFAHHFADWNFGWLDVPTLIDGAEAVFEYPMVDRDPVDRWVDGNTALLGDAAHVMYPVGSNGASQAIVDARVLGACFVAHGVGPEALLSYEDRLLDDVSALVLRNRGAGPVGILGVVDERCGGVFDDINDVIPRTEVEQFMANYKQAAGFAVESLNNSPPTIARQRATGP